MQANSHEEPVLIMLIGLPGSGKSTFAKKFQCDINVHSSDDLRLELYGDENDNNHNNELFDELHRRIRKDLKDGKSVIYDATNISKKYRVAFLKNLHVSCRKVCFVIAEDFETCLERNNNRERVVPYEAMVRMRRNYNPPWYSEGWNNIYIIFNDKDNFRIPALLSNDFIQDNEHHSLSFWEHSKKAASYIKQNYPDNYLLYYAALIHDIGKIYTKSRLNSKGEDDGNCHYYNHHCAGAYEAMFYAAQDGFNNADVLYISNLVYYHMHPYMWEKMNDEAKEKHIKPLGKMYDDIMRIHEADLYAH